MRSHDIVLRMLVAMAAIITCMFILFTVFHLNIADGFSIAPPPERPFFYEQHAPATHDDDYRKYNEEGHHRGPHGVNRDYKVLLSSRNSLGFYNKIDVRRTGYQIMNPTLLELPRNNNRSADFLIIARATPHIGKEINGTKYLLSRQVATFANLTYNNLGRPILQAGDKWSKILLEDFTEAVGPEHHCKHQPRMDRYIGPEDMKLFWTRKGEPLLIFTNQVNDENLCQGQFVVDVRAALPELETALGDDYSQKLPPVRFHEPTGLRRQAPPGQESHPRYQREKNWAPAQSPFGDDNELLFMVEPGQLFRWISSDSPVEEVVSAESAVEAPYPPNTEPSATWHSQHITCIHDVMLTDSNVHQSTPMLSLTLCGRGICEPDEQNTVMLGIVQRLHDRPSSPFTWYDRRIAVYSAAAPYNMLSVSKRFTYHGEVDGKYIWTGSMVYFTNGTQFPPRNHGYLDDDIWLSFGIEDLAAGWIDIKASDLIADHYLCQGASQEYR